MTIKSKVPNKAYRDGWDSINWSKVFDTPLHNHLYFKHTSYDEACPLCMEEIATYDKPTIYKEDQHH